MESTPYESTVAYRLGQRLPILDSLKGRFLLAGLLLSLLISLLSAGLVGFYVLNRAEIALTDDAWNNTRSLVFTKGMALETRLHDLASNLSALADSPPLIEASIESQAQYARLQAELTHSTAESQAVNAELKQYYGKTPLMPKTA